MNLHLTELRISYEGAAKAGLRDSYDWHQKLWMAFPDRPNEQRRFLSRVEPRQHCIQALLISQELPCRPDWCPLHGWRTKEIPASFLGHSQYRLSLLANPTRNVVVRDTSGNRKKNGQRVPIRNREDRLDPNGKPQSGLISWLQRKGERHGFTFEPDRMRTVPKSRNYFIKKGQAGVHDGVEFQGVINITNPNNFAEAFQQGIGKGKAFGYGMLVLAPIPTNNHSQPKLPTQTATQLSLTTA